MRIRDLLVALLTVLIFCLALTAFGDTLTEERIIKPPQDQNKWYISVIGEGKQYQEILTWFDTGSLKYLRPQVHFITVTPDSPIYKARYVGNIKALPTVRVQEPDGTLIYEAAGSDVPNGSEALNVAIATASAEVMAEKRPRRDKPEPKPEPKPDAPKFDLKPLFPFDPPSQPLSDGGPPKFEFPEFNIDYKALTVVCLLALLFGLFYRRNV